MRLVKTVLRIAAVQDGPTLEAKQRVRAAFRRSQSERQDAGPEAPTWWFPHDVETALEGLRRSTTTLCAVLAPAARDRVQPLVPFGDRLTEQRALETMDQRGVDALLRPVFEAAGVSRRFLADTPPDAAPVLDGTGDAEAPAVGEPAAAPPIAPAAELIAPIGPAMAPAAEPIVVTAPDVASTALAAAPAVAPSAAGGAPMDGDALLEHLLSCRERISYGAAHRALVGPVAGAWSLRHYVVVRQIVRDTAPRSVDDVDIRLEELIVSKKAASAPELAGQQRHEGDAPSTEATSWRLCAHSLGAADGDRLAQGPRDSATELPRSAERPGDTPTGATTTA